MKTTWAIVALLAAGTFSAVALAQPPEGKRGFPGPPFGPPPLIVALDTDRDGTLSSEEIAKAAEALKALDKNGDGKLSEDELRPALPPRVEGRGPGAFGPPPGGPREGGPPEGRRGRRDRAPREAGPPPHPPEGAAGMPPLVPPHIREALDLTDEQAQQLADLHKEIQEKLKGILSEEQREKLAHFPPPPPGGFRAPRPPRGD